MGDSMASVLQYFMLTVTKRKKLLQITPNGSKISGFPTRNLPALIDGAVTRQATTLAADVWSIKKHLQQEIHALPQNYLSFPLH